VWKEQQLFERDGYPPGVPCWVDTAQPDPEAAVKFYGDLFGWEFVNRMPPGAPGQYYIAQLRGLDVAAIGSQPEGSPPTPVWNTYIQVESADDAAAKVEAEGGSVISEPFDVFDAGRMAVVADPSGAAFCLWQAGTHKGSAIVNEPGTWNFSDLNTRDPQGAKAFYGAVFGWEATDLEYDGQSFVMLGLPSYGDHLEKLNPGNRARQAEFGAPPGFADAVAWLQPMTEDRFPPDTPPHWSITFTVDDADAIATSAVDLGGTVLVPPFDAPPTRVTVLSDPQGAVFTASKFDPTMGS
jgi:predicted enzyme related to lactoylglutathione lyase